MMKVFYCNRQILRDCTYHKIRGKINLSSTKEQARITIKDRIRQPIPQLATELKTW